jgi:hypothetical protein
MRSRPSASTDAPYSRQDWIDMVRLLTLLLAVPAAALAIVGGAAAAGSPRLYVATTGSDASSCAAAAPCASFDRAYHAAQPGQVVQVAGGTYANQQLSQDASKTAPDDVVIEPAAGQRVTLTGRLTLSHTAHVTLRNITVGRDDPYWDLLLQPCNEDVTLDHVGGGRYFAITEGNSHITFLGGSWGGYGNPGEHDSVIGTGGPVGSCDGVDPAPPSHDILFDGVLWHDSFWGLTPDQWGGAHPDCLEIDGYVNGVTIRNSSFVRCGDSFIGIYGDLGGPTENVTIERNLFLDGVTYGYWGIQMTDDGHPYHCSGIVFRNNLYTPNSRNAPQPYGPLLTHCSGPVPSQVVGNVFQSGPDDYGCAEMQAPPWSAVWDRNVFLVQSPCGTRSLLLRRGY